MQKDSSHADKTQANRRGWRRWPPRVSLRGLLIFQAAIAALLALAYWWPKSEQLQVFAVPSERNVGFYRGLGLVDGPGFFGKDYYRFKVSRGEPDDTVSVEVFYDGEEYSPFRGYYPDGTLREEGTCLVEFFKQARPLPLIGDLKYGRFYKPDGTLGSEVNDGTGVATVWFVDGVRMRECRMENYEYMGETVWDHEGNVIMHTTP